MNLSRSILLAAYLFCSAVFSLVVPRDELEELARCGDAYCGEDTYDHSRHRDVKKPAREYPSATPTAPCTTTLPSWTDYGDETPATYAPPVAKKPPPPKIKPCAQSTVTHTVSSLVYTYKSSSCPAPSPPPKCPKPWTKTASLTVTAVSTVTRSRTISTVIHDGSLCLVQTITRGSVSTVTRTISDINISSCPTPTTTLTTTITKTNERISSLTLISNATTIVVSTATSTLILTAVSTLTSTATSTLTSTATSTLTRTISETLPPRPPKTVIETRVVTTTRYKTRPPPYVPPYGQTTNPPLLCTPDNLYCWQKRERDALKYYLMVLLSCVLGFAFVLGCFEHVHATNIAAAANC